MCDNNCKNCIWWIIGEEYHQEAQEHCAITMEKTAAFDTCEQYLKK